MNILKDHLGITREQIKNYFPSEEIFEDCINSTFKALKKEADDYYQNEGPERPPKAYLVCCSDGNKKRVNVSLLELPIPSVALNHDQQYKLPLFLLMLCIHVLGHMKDGTSDGNIKVPKELKLTDDFRIIGVIISVESYMVKADPDHVSEEHLRPSEHPDRQETLIFHLDMGFANVLRTYTIDRSDGIKLSEESTSPEIFIYHDETESSVEGNLAGLFNTMVDYSKKLDQVESILD